MIEEYLKQVRLDHKEEAKRKQVEVKDKYKGIVFIDVPKSFSQIKRIPF